MYRRLPRHLSTTFHRLLSTSAAEPYLSLLQSTSPTTGPSLEIALSRSKSNLDPTIVDSVLRSPSIDRSLRLRFFVWAAHHHHPHYRHSPATYSRAVHSLGGVDRDLLFNLLRSYRAVHYPVSVKTFRVLLNLCKEANLFDLAPRLLETMRTDFNCRPDTASYNVAVRLCIENRDLATADRLMEGMSLAGLRPNMVTFVSAIKGFCEAGRFDDAERLARSMEANGCSPNVVVYSALLHGACKCGNLEKAMELLGEMEKATEAGPNVVTYTCLIQCLCDADRVDDALRVLGRMRDRDCSANRVTIVALTDRLSADGRISDACEVVERGFIDGGEGYSSLVVSLLRANNVSEAERVVVGMLERELTPDGLSRNSLIVGLCSVGRSVDGLRWYCRFEEEMSLPVGADACQALLEGLCRERRLGEAAALIDAMGTRGVRLRGLSVDGVEFLAREGGEDLVSKLMRIKGERT
ncbi:Pentatricopeptide repeat-containing protein [Acorus calamus]|uniref:Pentatricopeptide repeat-containing protein n=1 Tax=Acorus calamus TaxID=4465 RepID=A0AAV9D8V2_ACOCL|nr:Pentatricopeptide repeat-containing protein [Acorus calamus]